MSLSYDKNDKGWTWADAAKAAKKQGGKLPTVKQVRKLCKKSHLYDGDHWCPAVTAEGKRDWVYVGNKPWKAGTSHVETWGYPVWGDKGGNLGHNCCLVVAGGFKKNNLSYAKTNTGYSWDSASKAAKAQGGKLPTLKQLRKFLKAHGALSDGDQWAAVRSKKEKSGKDWCYVGNKPWAPGTSHCETWSYPVWGDAGENKGFNCTLVVFGAHCEKKKAVTYYKAKHGWSHADAAKEARKMGGRLPTLEEVRKLTKDVSLYPGEDMWCACTSDKGKDWVYVGSKPWKAGTSHCETWSYPAWGDKGENKGFNNCLVVVRGKKVKIRKEEKNSSSESTSSSSSSSSDSE